MNKMQLQQKLLRLDLWIWVIAVLVVSPVRGQITPQDLLGDMQRSDDTVLRVDAVDSNRAVDDFGHEVIFETFNCRLVVPRDWVDLVHDDLDPMWTGMWGRQDDQIVFGLIAEDAGVNAGVTLANVVASYRDQVESLWEGAGSGILSERKVDFIAGDKIVRGYQFASRMGGEAELNYRVMWVWMHRGYIYQALITSAWDCRLQADLVSRKIRDSFKQIDPERNASGLQVGRPIDHLRVKSVGFEADLTGGQWHLYSPIADQWPNALAYGYWLNRGGVVLLGLPVDGLDLTDHELAKGVLGQIFNKDVLENIRLEGEVQMRGAAGYKYKLIINLGDGEESYRYGLRVVRNTKWAYIVIGWTLIDDEAGFDELSGVMDRFRFDQPSKNMLPIADRSKSADLLLGVGAQAYEAERYDVAEQCFKRSYAFLKSDVTLDWLLHSMRRQDKYEEAARFGRVNLWRVSNRSQFEEHVGICEASLQRWEKAIDRFDQVFSDKDYAFGWDTLYYYSLALKELGQFDEVVVLIEKLEKRGELINWPVWHADVLEDLGRVEDAIAVYERAFEHGPLDPFCASSWLRLLVDQGDAKRVFEVCEKMLEEGYDIAEVYFGLGEAHVLSEDYELALGAYEKALEKAPSDQGIIDRIDLVRRYLGQGDNRLVSQSIEPVAVVDQLAMRLDALDDPDPDQLADAAILDYMHLYRIEKDQPQTYTRFVRVRIQKETAVEQYATIYLNFDSQNERVFLNELVVKDADGLVVAEGDVESCFVVDYEQEGIHSDDKTLVVPVPGLRPGCELSYRVSRQSLSGRRGLGFDHWYGVSQYPMRHTTVALMGQLDEVQVAGYNGAKWNVLVDGKYCVMLPDRYVWEPYQLWSQDVYPYVCFGTSDGDWAELGQGYLEQLSGRMSPVSLAKAEAEQVIDRKGFGEQYAAMQATGVVDRQVVGVLADYVRQLLSYEAIAFGVRGRIPHTVSEIFEHRYGDCKDHTLLLWQMLQSIGVESHLALVQTQLPVEKTIPTLNQFDHMVVVVPGIEPEGVVSLNTEDFVGDGDEKRDDLNWVIDGTMKSYSAMSGTAYAYHDQGVFVLDPDGCHFVFPQSPQAQIALITSKCEVVVDERGDAVIKEEVIFGGVLANSVRDDYQGVIEANYQSVLQHSFSGQKLDVLSLELENLQTQSRPVRMHIEYMNRELFEPLDDELLGRWVAPWVNRYLQPTYVANRQTPFVFRIPLQVDSKVTFVAPPGYRFGRIPSGSQIATDYGEIDVKWKHIEEGRLVLESSILRYAGQYEAAEYVEFQKQMRQKLRMLRSVIGLQKVDVEVSL